MLCPSVVFVRGFTQVWYSCNRGRRSRQLLGILSRDRTRPAPNRTRPAPNRTRILGPSRPASEAPGTAAPIPWVACARSRPDHARSRPDHAQSRRLRSRRLGEWTTRQRDLARFRGLALGLWHAISLASLSAHGTRMARSRLPRPRGWRDLACFALGSVERVRKARSAGLDPRRARSSQEGRTSLSSRELKHR